MSLSLAILLPALYFFNIDRPIAGIICFLLQISIIGWLPAAIWSVYVLNSDETGQKNKAITGRD